MRRSSEFIRCLFLKIEMIHERNELIRRIMDLYLSSVFSTFPFKTDKSVGRAKDIHF